MKTIEVNKLPSELVLNLGALRSSSKRPGVIEALPEITYVRPRVLVNAKAVKAYAKVCGFSEAQGVPMLFPHLQAFPLAMMLFGSKRFPWSAMGLVHLANRAKLLKRILIGDELRIEMRTGELYAHEKGQVFTLHAQALRGPDVVWTSTWTLLRMGVHNPKGPAYVSALLPDAAPVAHQADFYAKSSIGRSYGRISGDVNPIHLSALSARIMGFRKAIAHGMWTKARALAILMPREAVDRAEAVVEFKTPLFLPSSAALWSAKVGADTVFEVRNTKGDKPHLRGQISY